MRVAKILVLALIVGQASEVNAAFWKMALQLWEGTCSLINNTVEISHFTGWLQPEYMLGKKRVRGGGLWKKVCPEKQLRNTLPPGINDLSRRHSRQRGESRTAKRLCPVVCSDCSFSGI